MAVAWRALVILCAGCGVDEVVARALDGAAMIDARPGPDARVRCAGYERLSGIADERYKGYRHGASWLLADSVCTFDGAALVVVDDAIEATAINTFMPDAPGGGPLWIGVTLVGGAWTTVAGVPASYLPWAPDEPAAGAACAALGVDGALYAAPCDVDRLYACECEHPPAL